MFYKHWEIGESREHHAASKSPQNNHNKGIELAIEKPNSMPNLRGTITDCTKISMVPPLVNFAKRAYWDLLVNALK